MTIHFPLTHSGRVTHICVVKITIIGSDNGLSTGRRQAIIWTNAGILLTGPLGTNFIEILIFIQTFSFNQMHLNMSSAKWRPFCLGLNVLTHEKTYIGCAYQRTLDIFEVKSAFEMLTVRGQQHTFPTHERYSCESVKVFETENVSTWRGQMLWSWNYA